MCVLQELVERRQMLVAERLRHDGLMGEIGSLDFLIDDRTESVAEENGGGGGGGGGGASERPRQSLPLPQLPLLLSWDGS